MNQNSANLSILEYIILNSSRVFDDEVWETPRERFRSRSNDTICNLRVWSR